MVQQLSAPKLLALSCLVAVVYSQGSTSRGITSLVNSLSQVTEAAAGRRRSNVFARSDREASRKERNNRLFGQVDAETRRIAGITVQQAAQLNNDQNLRQRGPIFAADGGPQRQEVAEIFSKTAAKTPRRNTCVFDAPNARPCDSKYREFSGRCANVQAGRRTWGMAGTQYIRVLPNQYEDGIEEVRVNEFSSNRPFMSARRISDTVTDTIRVLQNKFSTHIMQWGQFIAHEITLLGEEEEDAFECCPDKIFRDNNPGNTQPTDQQLDKIRDEIEADRGDVCIAIENTDDSVFGDFVCMSLTRSTIAPNHDCSPGPRQQVNLNTHLVDGSAVYGSSKEAADELRSFSGGKMAVQIFGGFTLPPGDLSDCPATTAPRCPFKGGDIRIFETPNLAAIHTVFIIAHNFIAEELQKVNPNWNDERLYQETRRIVAGIESTIHYNDYLKLLLGSRIHARFIRNDNGFDPDVNPSVLNEMAGAAHRYGHSIVEGDFVTISSGGNRVQHDLKENFFLSDNVYDFGHAAHLRGIQDIKSRLVDRHFPTQMRNQLFAEDRDIVSINLQRGRDHGFASYIDYRRNYGLSTPFTWNSMLRTHPFRVVQQLKRVYSSPRDVELYIGGVTEKPARGGAILGETFAHIIGDGYRRLRDGDRLFYSHPDSGLTPEQISEIDQTSFAHLLCIGSDLETVGRDPFLHTHRTREVPCSLYRTGSKKFNFQLWKDGGSGSSCVWRDTSVSRCCQGRQTVRRTCVKKPGHPNCTCVGNPVRTQSCRCRRTDFACIFFNLACGHRGKK